MDRDVAELALSLNSAEIPNWFRTKEGPCPRALSMTGRFHQCRSAPVYSDTDSQRGKSVREPAPPISCVWRLAVEANYPSRQGHERPLQSSLHPENSSPGDTWKGTSNVRSLFLPTDSAHQQVDCCLGRQP